ncbi:hypothetical protein WOLCODRAFT_147595 [Wolfiporia cocos MD-104 SS10]|uniref:Uncharacterized protein n=1 Tax=Wolfiporia cocos (strain MD-104) TaxID=742152 RepID=A0A2H3J431_WOLCO|nr:hypothetical protein WOLCODRAFT_147595 [Wolfiporia cocos MD-104 SS10]
MAVAETLALTLCELDVLAVGANVAEPSLDAVPELTTGAVVEAAADVVVDSKGKTVSDGNPETDVCAVGSDDGVMVVLPGKRVLSDDVSADEDRGDAVSQ